MPDVLAAAVYLGVIQIEKEHEFLPSNFSIESARPPFSVRGLSIKTACEPNVQRNSGGPAHG